MSAPNKEDREREPFRWCVYCGADCQPDAGGAVERHAADCPSNTGVFDVRPSDLGPECPHCGERPGGFACTRCAVPLGIGDRYMRAELEPADPSLPGVAGASISEVVCIGCATHDALGADR
ncbi:MAG: hypothetical protein REI11_04605 [Patulibacter sp.]|nr:hypothetical protein [Patulibacter sp.]